jgi:hypothetical protein
MEKSKRPQLHPRIFWDTDFKELDYDEKYKFIIERVFSHGDVPDIRECNRYYGMETIREVLLNAKFLPKVTMYLASAFINEPIEKFRCYTLRQSNPKLLPY